MDPLEPEKSTKDFDANMERWRMEHEGKMEEWRRQVRVGEISWKATLDFGTLAIKSLIIANGGAVLALLTFLGSLLANKGPTMPEAAALIGTSMRAFVVGVGAAVATAGVAYLSQAFFTKGIDWQAGKDSRVGIGFQILAILLALLSLVAFSYGAWLAASALSRALG
jgi:hypothetical protein